MLRCQLFVRGLQPNQISIRDPVYNLNMRKGRGQRSAGYSNGDARGLGCFGGQQALSWEKRGGMGEAPEVRPVMT